MSTNTRTCELCGAASPENDLRYFLCYAREQNQYVEKKVCGVKRLLICEKCIRKKKERYPIGPFFGGLLPFAVIGTYLLAMFAFKGTFEENLPKSAAIGVAAGLICGFCLWLCNRNKSAAFLGGVIFDEKKDKDDRFVHPLSAERAEYPSKKYPDGFNRDIFDSRFPGLAAVGALIGSGKGNETVDRLLERKGRGGSETRFTEQEFIALLLQGTGPLLVYFDIDRLGGGAYGLEAGRAIGRILPASIMENVQIFSGDSAASLSGGAGEYVVCMNGSDETISAAESRLRADPDLGRLLSSSGIRRGQTKEPLVQDGTVRGGKLAIPEGKSESFCAAGIRKEWEK